MAQIDPILDTLAPGALPELCRRFRVRRLDLFGSATSERFTPASDLDILVTFEDIGATAYADAYFGLWDALAVAFGRPVDLVTASALDNPFFRRVVEAERRQLFP